MNHRVLLFLAFVFFIQSRPELASAQTSCLNNGNYTQNSTYAANLNATFSLLSRGLTDTGFSNASAGDGADRANAVVLCRGDAQLEACRSCIRESRDELLRSCPNLKQAVRWEERCMLRYSNATIYGAMTIDPMWYLWINESTATSPYDFERVARELLTRLFDEAAAGDSHRKVAAGNETVPAFTRVFALVQCTPDLSKWDCTSCLYTAYGSIKVTFEGKRGYRFFTPSCTLRFEIYPFFNESRIRELVAESPSPPLSLPLPLSPSPSPPLSLPLSPPLSSSSEKGDGNTTRTVIIIVVPIVVGLLLAVSTFILLRKRKTQKPTEVHYDYVDEIIISTPESVQYAFSTIKSATNNFSDDNKLGQGGFGSVYKGKLPNGQEIAVKRLSMNSGQGDLEFKNEVLLLAKLQHRNLVRLFGFAIERTEKLLIYELVQNASLDKFIFEKKSRSYLDWDRRCKIIGGIARGILYLHEDSRLKIIHRDLKASNILLDGKMNPKIADFGMARLFGEDETQQNTNRVVGTYGYMAPEYAMEGVFSVKSDVFSFGVMLLEIISGKRNHGSFHHGQISLLLAYAWELWEQGKEGELVDPMLRENCPMQQVERCIQIGLMCVQENAEERPNMSQVVFFLESEVAELPNPNKPAFSVGRDAAAAAAAAMLKSRSAGAFSVNQVTVSSIMPR